MKLEPKAKPVRIRIKSGGEEHFNLESLKRNFSVQDLWEAVTGGSLSRWLRQQNETELAKKVDAFCQIEKPTAEDYIKFSSLFFERETNGVSIKDADALIKFYQDNDLEIGLQESFSYLLDSMDYKRGRVWFDKFRDLKEIKEWIDFFKAKWMHLDEMEEVEYYFFLSKLYKENGELIEMEKCQSKTKELIYGLVKENVEYVDKLLKTNEFFFINTLFEYKTARKVKGNEDWIHIFENCQNDLLEEEKGVYFLNLASLYGDIGDEKKELFYLQEANRYGCEVANEKLYIHSKYPKMVELLKINNKRLDNLTVEDLSEVGSWLYRIREENALYQVFYRCVRFFAEVNNDAYDFESPDQVRDERDELFRQFSQFELISLTAGLAWEYKKGNVELYDVISPTRDYYKKIITAKRMNKKMIVSTKDGIRNYLWKDSMIKQLFFFMLTYGENYSFKNVE